MMVHLDSAFLQHHQEMETLDEFLVAVKSIHLPNDVFEMNLNAEEPKKKRSRNESDTPLILEFIHGDCVSFFDLVFDRIRRFLMKVSIELPIVNKINKKNLFGIKFDFRLGVNGVLLLAEH